MAYRQDELDAWRQAGERRPGTTRKHVGKRMEEEMAKGNDEWIARYSQIIVEAPEEVVQRSAKQQGNQADTQGQRGERSRTEDEEISVKDKG